MGNPKSHPWNAVLVCGCRYYGIYSGIYSSCGQAAGRKKGSQQQQESPYIRKEGKEGEGGSIREGEAKEGSE